MGRGSRVLVAVAAATTLIVGAAAPGAAATGDRALWVWDAVIAGAELATSLSQLVESLDDDARRNLNDHFKTATVTLYLSDIEKIADAHGGIVVKTLGDGAMLAYDSARSAAQSAVAIQHGAVGHDAGALPGRVGVHTGDAVHSDGDHQGHAVNKAARIAAAAEGGQVLGSNVVRGLVERTPRLVFGEPPILELKGLPGSHVAYALEGR